MFFVTILIKCLKISIFILQSTEICQMLCDLPTEMNALLKLCWEGCFRAIKKIDRNGVNGRMNWNFAIHLCKLFFEVSFTRISYHILTIPIRLKAFKTLSVQLQFLDRKMFIIIYSVFCMFFYYNSNKKKKLPIKNAIVTSNQSEQ